MSENYITLDDLNTRIHTVETPKELWQLMLNFYQQRGIKMASYHHLGNNKSPSPMDDLLISTEGFPDDWVCEYIEARLYTVDPIPELALSSTRPFLWSETRRLINVTEEQSDFLHRLTEKGLGDGLAIQVFGPLLRNGYVGLGFGREAPNLTPQAIRELQYAAQLGHLAYCNLVSTHNQAAMGLTPRENEILEWIARGKSNSVIAQILGVSPHTIDTLVRRMFEKLNVRDRVSAAIKGLGSGLIQTGLKDVA